MLPSYEITRKSAIYGIFGPSGKVYIGSAVSAARRRKEHRNRLDAGLHHCSHLQRAWTKHGAAAFEFRILEDCAGLLPVELIPREQHWIDAYNGSLYNSTPRAGSLAGYKFNPAVLMKMAVNRQARPPQRHSEETKKLLSELATGRPSRNKGVPMTADQRGNMSAAALRRPPVSAATKEKLSTKVRRRYATGWRPRYFTGIRKPEVAEMVTEIYRSEPNMSATAIAKRLGLRRHTVTMYLRTAGIDLSARNIPRPPVSDDERTILSRLKTKLTQAQVLEIQARSKGGESLADLALAYGVSKPVIIRARHGRPPYDKVII